MLPNPQITLESPRLFRSNVLEWLSRCHPVVVTFIYMPLSAALVWYSIAVKNISWTMVIPTVLIGAVLWTFVEYWLHRGVFHWVPKIPGGNRIHFWVHGIHHRWPNDKYRLVMPIPVSMVLFFLFLGGFHALLGSMAWSFHAGFSAGYVGYEFIHFWVHHGTSRGKLYRLWQRHHLSHHFKPGYYDLCYAVSLPTWDTLFRTKNLSAPTENTTAHVPADAKVDDVLTPQSEGRNRE
jgi:sterol desaturase/sphingolipid hydroxylase (fatty acid hydroxylase superfamily)